MVTDADASACLVDTMLATVTDNDRIANLGSNVSQMALRDAAEHIVDEVEKIILRNKA
jgi:UDP-N-acetylglucosamine:LPS N-acetylglucosamine transferase